MEITRRLPLWLWWIIGIAVIGAVSAGAVFFIRSSRPSIPPGLVEKREEISRLLEESGRIGDVDIRPLAEMESKKDYSGVAALMERALESNAEHEKLSQTLVKASDELANTSVRVMPDTIGTKAITAFGVLSRLAQAEKKFYANRRLLYEMTRDYYADLAAKKNPTLPDNLRALVLKVNADLDEARALHQQFASAIKIFDKSIVGIK